MGGVQACGYSREEFGDFFKKGSLLVRGFWSAFSAISLTSLKSEDSGEYALSRGGYLWALCAPRNSCPAPS